MIGAIPGASLPQWSREFELGTQLSWYFNLFLLGIVIGIAFTSRLKVRHPWLSLQVGLIAVGLLIAALWPGFDGVLLAAALLGFGVGGINLHANALPGELYPENRLLVLSRVNTAFGLGAVIAPLLAVVLPWRSVFLLLALVVLAAAITMWKAPPPERQPLEQHHTQVRGLWRVLFTVVLYVGFEVCLATFAPRYMQEVGFSAAVIGVLLALYWGSLSLGRLALSNFIAQHTLWRVNALLIAAALLCILFFAPAALWLFPLAGFLLGPTFPTFFTLVRGRFGYKALEYLFYAGSVGGTIVPALFALIGSTFIPIGWLGLGLGLGVLFYIMRRQHAGFAF